MKRTSLNGLWQLRNDATGDLYPATVPGVVHTDLMAAGIIDRPYYRENEREYAWIAEHSWTYTRMFEVDEASMGFEAQYLVFDGLDTFAEIRLNGVFLGETDNMFRRYTFDLTSLLRAGRNELEVTFHSPTAQAAAIAKQIPYKIPYTGEREWFITDTHRNLIRKCQCHAGWDWGPAFLTSGIWKNVTLYAIDGLRIEDVKPLQFHTDNHVNVQTALYLDVVSEDTYEITVSLAGVERKETLNLPPGKRTVIVELELENPALWWPLGYGAQNLYQLDVAISASGKIIARHPLRIGLRQVELVREDDAHGQSFFFRVNGVPIFLKGYNWIPVDCFASRMTREVYADLIGSAATAHCNLLRVWGGGIYENDDFYNLCDEQGILVWQDFMFACAMYPWDDAFLANVTQEVTEQIRRLSAHPSILLWSGNNECEMAIDWYTESRADRERFRAGYHKLFIETIGAIAQAESPNIPYWPSSPSNGPGLYGDSNATNRGDTHYWEVWHGGKPFSEYLTVHPRMSSEYGFQSVPSPETLRDVMDRGDFNIASPMMDYRQRSAIGNRAMVEHMMGEYFLPTNFAHFAYLSQVQQAMAMKIATEHWRRLSPVNMGTVIWQLNDIWPGNSWSSIEYGGKWKILHSVSKRFFAPVLLSLAKIDTGVEVWATNDGPTAVQGHFTLEARDFSGGVIREWRGSYTTDPCTSTLCLTLPHETLASLGDLHTFFLVLRGDDSGDGLFNWTFLRPAKFCALQKPAVSLEISADAQQTQILLQTDRPAFHVWLDIPERRGTFDDNGLLLLPDSPKRIIFTPKDQRGPVQPADIRLTHLRDTY